MLIASVSIPLSYIYDSPTRCILFAFIMCLIRCLVQVLGRMISRRGAQETCEQRRQPALVRSNLFEINVSTLF